MFHVPKKTPDSYTGIYEEHLSVQKYRNWAEKKKV